MQNVIILLSIEEWRREKGLERYAKNRDYEGCAGLLLERTDGAEKTQPDNDQRYYH